ncbi:MAG: M81 family metallopeptidase [Ruminococcaceae bacterium]|nr:M81 family metallopeptidase [Oscillospiraceae bacterium]
MKIIIGHFGHEANTFAEKHVDFATYTSRGFTTPENLISEFENTRTYLGGIIAGGREEGVEFIPACGYTAAAPVLTRECVQKMMDMILPVCEANKDADGVCFALHGAGVGEGIPDLEGYVLTEIRKILGNEIPITVTKDLHGNISPESVALTNGVFGIRKYPHTDKYEAGYLAIKNLCAILRGEYETETYVEHLPLVIPISTGMTGFPPFPEIDAFFDRYRDEKGLIHVSLFQGFPYADTPWSTASVCVVGKKGCDAEKAAKELARFVWERRHYFKVHSNSPAEAFDLAEKVETEGYIIINDMSDNPGGGCPGDGTHLLREMLRRDLPGSIFGFMVDPVAIEELYKHRPGDTVSFRLGGRNEKIFGKPLEIRNAELISLFNGTFTHTSPNLLGKRSKLGRAARIRVSNVDIIIATARNQTFDDRPFMVLGADLNDYRYVGLKSTQHFRGYFQSRAAQIIPSDPPGLCSSDLSVFPFEHLPRPVYPLDTDTEYQA